LKLDLLTSVSEPKFIGCLAAASRDPSLVVSYADKMK
jgi:hypothetical protein